MILIKIDMSVWTSGLSFRIQLHLLMNLITQHHQPKLLLLLLVQVIFFCLSEFCKSICIWIRQTQIVGVNRAILKNTSAFEKLSCSCWTSYYDSSIYVLLSYVFEDFFNAFDAGTPATDPAQKYVVGDIAAIFAFAHVLVQFWQGQGDLDEQIVRIYVFELVYFHHELFAFHCIEQFRSLFLLELLKFELVDGLFLTFVEEELL